eukprot:gene16594-22659_t
MEDSSFGDFMSEVEQHVQNLLREASVAPKDAWEQWCAFSSAINWKEPFIIGLLSFHIFILIFVIATRSNTDVQAVIFLFICGFVMLLERINTICGVHWRTFSTQNYFDTSGVFAGIMVAAPLILICLFQLVNFLIQTSFALIKAKRRNKY